MLKRTITYEDFNGEPASEIFYFNFTKTELIRLEVSYDGGMLGFLQRIVESENQKEMVTEFEKIILLAYGVKSDDGKQFIKSDTLREEFLQTAAYDALFQELTTDENAAAIFVESVLPKALRDEVAKEMETPSAKLPAPPAPPSA